MINPRNPRPIKNREVTIGFEKWGKMDEELRKVLSGTTREKPDLKKI